MDAPMQELDRWKDRVELSLDGRQIFFLFFGSAVAACLIFVAGVLVGKRIEARSLSSAVPVAEDPLAALDQIDSAEQGEEFAFPDQLRNAKRSGAGSTPAARTDTPPAPLPKPAAV